MKTVTAGDTCLFVFCICVVLHVTYGQTQVVLVTELTNSVSLFESPSNFTALWDSSSTEINEFILSSSNYSIQISRNNQKINIETNRINFPSFSLETENCVIIIDGYNEMLDILQNNQQIITENTEEITIQDKTFQLFETTNLTIGFEVNKMNKKSIIPKADPPCCNISDPGDITISSNCTCENAMKIKANSIEYQWTEGNPPITFIAPSIEIESTEDGTTLFLLQFLKFESDTLLATSKGGITIVDASFSVSTITMNGTRVTSTNMYSSEVTSLTLIGFSNGVYFCGNVASFTNVNLIGTSNDLKGVEICDNIDQSKAIMMKNLYIEGISNTDEGVRIRSRFSCTENTCEITGESSKAHGVYLYTAEISNAKITGTSEQSNGIYIDSRKTDTGTHFYEEIDLIGSGIIGVEINLLDQIFFDNLKITGTSLSNTDGIKFTPFFRQLQITGNLESINGSIRLPNYVNISSAIYPDLLELKSDNQIIFESFVNDQVSIYLGSNGILDIINGYLNVTRKLLVSGLSTVQSNKINIPNGGKIEGDAVFQHRGISNIGNGLEVGGALTWNIVGNVLLCGDIVAITGSIILPLNVKAGCSIPNQLNMNANSAVIIVYKIDGHETFMKPPILISANNININNKVNLF